MGYDSRLGGFIFKNKDMRLSKKANLFGQLPHIYFISLYIRQLFLSCGQRVSHYPDELKTSAGF